MVKRELYTLFVSHNHGDQTCEIFPTLEEVYDALETLAEECDGAIEDSMPTLPVLEHLLEKDRDYCVEFNDTTWAQVEKQEQQVVDNIAGAWNF